MIDFTDIPRRSRDELQLSDMKRIEGLCDACGKMTPHTRFEPEDPEAYRCDFCVADATFGIEAHVNEHNGIYVVGLDFWADPAKNPRHPEGKAWIRAKERAYANEPWRFRQEYLRDHDCETGARIYPEFNIGDHYDADLGFNPDKLLVLSFDWGLVHPAAIFGQWVDGTFNILTEILGFDTPLPHFLEQVGVIMSQKFFLQWGLGRSKVSPRLVEALQNDATPKLFCCGDHAGQGRSNMGVSDVQFVSRLGYNIHTRFTMPSRRIEKVRSLLPIREDGKARLKLRGQAFSVRGTDPAKPFPNEQPGTAYTGFLGGYKYEADAHGVLRLTRNGPTPSKDVYSHIQDAISEAVEHTLEMLESEKPVLDHPMDGMPGFVNLRKLNPEHEDYDAVGAYLAKWYHNPGALSGEDNRYEIER